MSDAKFLNDTRKLMEQYRSLAERAIGRVSEQQFFEATGDDTSIAIIVKHLAGSQKSRWTDFLSTDGEKDDRHRDSEFQIVKEDSREALMRRWDEAWAVALGAVDAAAHVSLDTIITIRQEPFTLLSAFSRSITHIAYHVGQIVWLARHLCSPKWNSLSIPKGESEKFNAAMRARFGKPE